MVCKMGSKWSYSSCFARGLFLGIVQRSTIFYFRSRWGQCLLLLAPGYEIGLWLGQVYLREEQDHLLNIFLNKVPAEYCLLLIFLNTKPFFLIDLLTSVVRNLGRLLTYTVLMYFPARLQWQCQRSRCHHCVSEPLLLSFYKVSLKR